MKLKNLQQDFFESRRTGRPRSSTLKTTIKAKRGLSARSRMNIYLLAYYDRLISALRADFEYTAKVLGEARFQKLAKEFLFKRPSRFYSLSDLGADFPRFLKTKKVSPLVQELSAFEWEIAKAYYIEEAPNTWDRDVKKLQTLSPKKVVFTLDPSVHLTRSNYPLHLFLEDSKAVRKKATQVLILRNRRGFGWAIPLSSEQARLFRALQKGRNLEQLTRSRFSSSSFLETTFKEWTQLGILRGLARS